MIRLTVTLIVAIYIILIVIPGPDHGEGLGTRRDGGPNWLVALITDAEASAQTPRRAAPSARAVQGNPLDGLTQTAEGYTLLTADGEVLQIAAVIDPVNLMAQAQAGAGAGDAPVAHITVAAPAGPETAAPPVAPAVTLAAAVAPAEARWRVAGASVNFRAGPSTETAVLTALERGEEVIYLADAAEDWAYLRVVSTGLEGYMAIRFLEPVN